MTIELLKREVLTDDLQHQMHNLYKQLNADNHQIPLKEILDKDNNVLVFVCNEDSKIIGTALLSTYKVISGYRGMVDDVVVDDKYRGKGIGRKLMERLLEEAKAIGLDEVLLFTGHHRKAAIKLYTNLGFEMRKSGIYNIRIN